MKSVSGLDTQVGGRDTQWSTLLSDFLCAQVYKQPCKKHKSRSYQRERCDLPYAAVYRTIQRFTLMDNKSTCAQIRFPLWTFLHTNDQFCVWKVDTLFTFVGFLPLRKSIILAQNLAHFEQKPRYSNRIKFHPIFWLCVHFFNRICGELIE